MAVQSVHVGECNHTRSCVIRRRNAFDEIYNDRRAFDDRCVVGAGDRHRDCGGICTAIAVIDGDIVALRQHLTFAQIINVGVCDIKAPADLAVGCSAGRCRCIDREGSAIARTIGHKARGVGV